MKSKVATAPQDLPNIRTGGDSDDIHELFGIYHTNSEESLMTKNVFTTFFPISAALYLSSKNRPVQYLLVRNNQLVSEEIMFENAIGVSRDDLRDISWDREIHPKKFKSSEHAPPVDMVPTLDGKQKLELEVKLTVVPTFANNKVTEMIVRQNTQFTFAERMVYYHKNAIDNVPVSTDTLRRAVRNSSESQKPFILHGLWQTVGTTGTLNEVNTADVFLISDYAYLWMILNSPLIRNRTPTRIGRVENRIRTWIENYLETGVMRYKESSGQSVDHLKIALYPSDHLEELKGRYKRLRLGLKDLTTIIPKASIKKISPERRLDASILYTILMGAWEKK